MTDYEVYQTYLGIKLHFTSDYDYVKYNGKVNASLTSYKNRKDQFFFKKISRIFNKEQVEHFFVSNFIENEKMWIREALTPECMGVYKNWQKKIESLQYTFQNDCKNILNFVLPQIEDVTPFDALMKKEKSFNNIFIVKNGQHPTILKMALANKINIETFIILNSIFKFIPRFNNEINETVIWPEFFAKCKKYRPFLEYNVDKYIKALKKVLDI
tara:strand:+ start:358 stop:999 length:642 start_codon:yes stop_codon:yes gene_type:complete